MTRTNARHVDAGLATRAQDRRGFVLPVVLLLLLVLSTSSVFFLHSSSDQQRAANALRESGRAFYAADAGVNEVVAMWDSLGLDTLMASPGDSVDLGWHTLVNGATYHPVVTRVDGGVGSRFYSLAVTGRGPREGSGTAKIYREFYTAHGDDFIRAAVEGGIDGEELELDFEGWGGVVVDGRDTIPAGWEDVCGSELVDKAGAIWNDSSRVDIENATITGAPPFMEDMAIDSASLFDFNGVTWEDLVSVADITLGRTELAQPIGPQVLGGECYTGGPDSWRNWGDPYDATSPCFDYFPVIHMTGELEIENVGGYGQGILLLSDEMEIEDLPGTFEFFGLIILQTDVSEGLEIEEAGVNIYGAVIAGDELDLEDGGHIRYSRCAVRRALAATGLFGSIRPLTTRGWRQVAS